MNSAAKEEFAGVFVFHKKDKDVTQSIMFFIAKVAKKFILSLLGHFLRTLSYRCSLCSSVSGIGTPGAVRIGSQLMPDGTKKCGSSKSLH